MSVSRPYKRHRAPMVSHTDVARRLAKQPFEWGPVNVYRTRSTAAATGMRIETAAFEAYEPAGAYEARFTMVDEGWAVEARCVRHVQVASVPRETSGAPFYRTQHRLRVLKVLLSTGKSIPRACIAELSDVDPSRTHKILQFLTERKWVAYRRLRDGTGRRVYRLTKPGREEAEFLLAMNPPADVPRETNEKEG